MPIEFTAQQWQRIQDTYTRWWAGELDRPIIQATLNGRDPGRPEPAVTVPGRLASHGLERPVEEIVDYWDYELSRVRFLGDAFPRVWLDFGPGVVAAFLGSELVSTPSERTVWFRPREDVEITDLRLPYRDDSPWLARVKDLAAACVRRWNGQVQIGMTDLGGAVDILSTFRPSERLLLDLYDHPDDVKRLVWEIHDAWFRYYAEIDAILQPANPGSTAWAGIFAPGTYYMLQCDFAYMIGPAMFDEFVRPELEACCQRLDYPFYHLDGPGQLPHLDSLLSIEKLGGVQWVPGAGAAAPQDWPDVYRRVLEAGKLAQFLGVACEDTPFDAIDRIVDRLGTGKGLLARVSAPIEQEDAVRRRLEGYGIEP